MLNAEQSRWLPGVPGEELERIITSYRDNEISTGQFDKPGSSSRLAANAFGYFLERPEELPALPGCREEGWPARSLAIERPVRLPERNKPPARLDALIVTEMDLIGVESKRYEQYIGPFFKRPNANETPEAYWSGDIWGKQMAGYQAVRDRLIAKPNLFAYLDAFQLIRHALALRTEVHLGNKHQGLSPILFYVYAEPPFWPDGKPMGIDVRLAHEGEIDSFSQLVQHDEVRFVPRPYRPLLWGWRNRGAPDVRTHAEKVQSVFTPC